MSKNHHNYRDLHLINVFITVVCVGGLTALANVFIQLWIGEKYLLSNVITNVIIINFALEIYRRTSLTYIDAYGLAWIQRWKSIIEVVINIVLTIFFAGVLKMGMLGILIGTTISIISFPLWYEPYIVYKYGFNVDFKEYFKPALTGLMSIVSEYVIVAKGIAWSKGISSNLVVQLILNSGVAIVSSLMIISLLIILTEDGRNLWTKFIKRNVKYDD